MKHQFRKWLAAAGILCFVLAFFQAVIGFFPSLSLYFGAPEILVDNIYALTVVSLFVALILLLFGFYAISGAGYIRPLPWLKPILIAICGIFIVRGFLLIPEALAVMEILQFPVPVEPRFIFFSLGSMVVGMFFLAGIRGGWNSFL